MPAVTLKHSTTHRNQNCGSLMACAAETAGPEPVAPGEACGGFGGCQSSAGTRTSSQPTDMKIA